MAATTTPTINTYVSDMLALEKHIAGPLEHQTKDASVAKYPEAARVIADAFAGNGKRIAALERRLEAIGGHAAAGLKSGVATTLGAAAAAIGDVRKTEVSKYLRDDYSALALASASYTLLHTTALALGDTATAELAQTGLADVATSVMRLSNTLPIVVLSELRNEGVNVDATVIAEAERNVDKAWKDGGTRSAN